MVKRITDLHGEGPSEHKAKEREETNFPKMMALKQYMGKVTTRHLVHHAPLSVQTRVCCAESILLETTTWNALHVLTIREKGKVSKLHPQQENCCCTVWSYTSFRRKMTGNRKCSELLQTGKMYCSCHKERTKSLSYIQMYYFLMLHGAHQVTVVFCCCCEKISSLQWLLHCLKIQCHQVRIFRKYWYTLASK